MGCIMLMWVDLESSESGSVAACTSGTVLGPVRRRAGLVGPVAARGGHLERGQPGEPGAQLA